jgi:predicted MPP superfamily phosphohydrolase
MPSLSWLHLTDLHRGLPGQRARWSSVRQAFYDDLSRLAARAGPWDLVLFTGDLTQRGSADEFALLDETLYALFDHLRALGSTPTLVTVPGNHDLARPRVNSVVRALRNWHHDRDLREEFWSTNDGEVHALLRECFSAYDAFAARWPLPPGFAERRGLIPGDRSISLSHNEIRLALVGLNSAFLQLEGGDYQGRLDLDPRQLLGVCGDDPGLFVDDHHLALLLTHHPSDWLHPRALADYRADITPPGRFAAHLFGHMHEPSAQTVAIAGAPGAARVAGPLAVWPGELRRGRGGAGSWLHRRAHHAHRTRRHGDALAAQREPQPRGRVADHPRPHALRPRRQRRAARGTLSRASVAGSHTAPSGRRGAQGSAVTAAFTPG